MQRRCWQFSLWSPLQSLGFGELLPLFDIRNNRGNIEADTIIVEGSMNFLGTTMPQLGRVTVNTAQALYGKAAANTVFAAFHARGIL